MIDQRVMFPVRCVNMQCGRHGRRALLMRASTSAGGVVEVKCSRCGQMNLLNLTAITSRSTGAWVVAV